MAARPPLPPEQLREAVRDLVGILRVMYAAERESPTQRKAIANAGHILRELEALAAEPESPEYAAAMRRAESAISAVLGSLHFNAALAPLVAHAAGRALDSRRR